MSYSDWFEQISGFPPHPWQLTLGEDETCRDRLLRIPTGFGKTAGTILAWAYHRVSRGKANYPTRLVFCLPMRVLVEQTESAVTKWMRAAELEVPVVVLLGGTREATWLEHPDRPTIVIGTQDMLLSRALGRGYGSSRGLWPMEMGLLHRDALWVVDEVQLMDVGLATTAQLHAFRGQDDAHAPSLRPTFTWWMSATLQPSWLETVDLAPRLAHSPFPCTHISKAMRQGGLWDVKKELVRRTDLAKEDELAAIAAEKHVPGTLTLLIVNTVDRAKKVEAVLAKRKGGPEVRLVHSRFRGSDRRNWDFLTRNAALPPAGRIVVATQVIEAGVDISARTLVTDLAPWSSLVQRFGRCARYSGERGQVTVAGPVPSDAKKALPYVLEELTAADRVLARLTDSAESDVGPKCLEGEEEKWAQDMAIVDALYPYQPLHVLRRRDFDDLFDTTPDLSGADLDVSRFIRSGEERDASVFWRHVEDPKTRELTDVVPPSREELCPVPVGDLRDVARTRGYARDYLSGTWRRPERVIPGMTVLLPSSVGCYDLRRGWDPKASDPVEPIEVNVGSDRLENASSSADDDELSAYAWKSIATHGRETGEQGAALGKALGLDSSLVRVLELAGRWHDAGKAHPIFQEAILDTARAEGGPVAARQDLAKAPENAWRRPPYPKRPGFRHELVSTLLLFELLRRKEPKHPALLGPHLELLDLMQTGADSVQTSERIAHHPLADEIASLSADDFDLLAYLVCSHHGKVRTSWSTTPRDQEMEHGGIHGVCEGDRIDAFPLMGVDGSRINLPELTISLACATMGLNVRYGASWSERVGRLLKRLGPFTLAYLESIFRVADWRASELPTPEDP